ncbi:MAG TPA: hypothetical protein DEF48_19825 [Nostoc sp. UBA8866]|nr:hypothetical protein [Nostoc sp. UBA8866]
MLGKIYHFPALLIIGMIFVGLRPANANTHSPLGVPLAVGAKTHSLKAFPFALASPYPTGSKLRAASPTGEGEG